jgi:DNA-directed RNA polymerase I, II, and III subunit RPABC1
VSKGYFVQIYGLENFLFNVARHQFVPKHTIIKKDEITKLMDKYNLKNLKNLPLIKWQDPQAKYIGLKPKMITRINSFNATTGDSITYRICVF